MPTVGQAVGVGDQLLEAVDGRDRLLLQFTPAAPQAGFAVGVGDILIVAPKRIEPTTEILQQVVVVVLDASRFIDMLTVRKNYAMRLSAQQTVHQVTSLGTL